MVPKRHPHLNMWNLCMLSVTFPTKGKKKDFEDVIKLILKCGDHAGLSLWALTTITYILIRVLRRRFHYTDRREGNVTTEAV